MCFFFKQKTAYEMRISDWSSDVCSSDLADAIAALQVEVPAGYEGTVNGTISVTTAEDTLSGVENDLTDNSKTITKDFSATVNGDPIDPSAAIGLPQGTTAIKEESVDNVVKLSASADNLTDKINTSVIELPQNGRAHVR